MDETEHPKDCRDAKFVRENFYKCNYKGYCTDQIDSEQIHYCNRGILILKLKHLDEGIRTVENRAMDMEQSNNKYGE